MPPATIQRGEGGVEPWGELSPRPNPAQRLTNLCSALLYFAPQPQERHTRGELLSFQRTAEAIRTSSAA